MIVFAVFLCLFSLTNAQRGTCTRAPQCPTGNAMPTVSISSDADFRYVKTDGCPPYENPKWTNPAEACTQSLTFKLPLKPKDATTPIPVGEPYGTYDGILYLKEDPEPIFGAMGVLKSGVMVFGVGSPCGYSSKCPDDGGPTKYVDAVAAEGHTTDQCGGHAAPTNQYHIHSGIGFNTSDDRVTCRLPQDMPNSHSQLLGWMFDGYGLYGPYSDGGKVPTDLDSCGGHTHDINGTVVYHYHLPSGFPWTIGCFTGCPEVSNNAHEFEDLAKYGC